MTLRKRILNWIGILLVLMLLLGICKWFAHNVLTNLQAHGMQTGFSFLREPAGFEISGSLISYDPSNPLWRAFLVGTLNTLYVALPATVLATVLGTIVGLGRLSPIRLARILCGTLTETLRNTPLLLQLLIWYFLISDVLPDSASALAPLPGVLLSKSGLFLPSIDFQQGWHIITPHFEGFSIEGGISLSPEYAAVLLALSLYSATFIAEIVRGGILSVPEGQIAAAQALGLSRRQVLRYVTAPLALRAIVPALTNQYLNLTKNSSLAVAIGYPDLVSIANTSINQTGRAFECIAIIMAVYASISLITAVFMNIYNRRVALRGSQP